MMRDVIPIPPWQLRRPAVPAYLSVDNYPGSERASMGSSDGIGNGGACYHASSTCMMGPHAMAIRA
jgi:hypothetical protein